MSQQQYALEKLQAIQARINDAEREAGRLTNSVTLIGASKKQNTELIKAFHQAGLRNIGENYLQEATDKYLELTEFKLVWHFIGQIQSNKTKPIAHHFNWVHGVDRVKIALRIARQNPRPDPVNLLLQLNLDDEQSKGGVAEQAACTLADQIAQALANEDAAGGGARLRGFMAIPKARNTAQEQRAVFARAHAVLTKTNADYGLGLTELSMGMSGDLEAAIVEGATMVRIGTDLFGARQ